MEVQLIWSNYLILCVIIELLSYSVFFREFYRQRLFIPVVKQPPLKCVTHFFFLNLSQINDYAVGKRYSELMYLVRDTIDELLSVFSSLKER